MTEGQGICWVWLCWSSVEAVVVVPGLMESLCVDQVALLNTEVSDHTHFLGLSGRLSKPYMGSCRALHESWTVRLKELI